MRSRAYIRMMLIHITFILYVQHTNCYQNFGLPERDKFIYVLYILLLDIYIIIKY